MAAADVGALLEVASSPEPIQAPVETSTEETPVESTEVEATETSEGGEGAPKTEADGGEKAPVGLDALRKGLKAFRDSSPENAPIARKLNDIVGRYDAMTKIFPKVADAQNAKFLLDSVGGSDGLATLQSTIKSVNDTDAMLYAGDPKVLDTLYEDMKAAGKPEAFGKLASPFLEKLREADNKTYETAVRPHLVDALESAGFADSLKLIADAISDPAKPNVEVLQKVLDGMKGWLAHQKELTGQSKKSALDPDRQAFEKERNDFQSEKKKAFEGEVHGGWNQVNNQVLGAALKPYLAMAFAKNWTDGTKKSVAQEIMLTLKSELSADKVYQNQMDALWSEAKPDKSKILAVHQAKMDVIGKRLVRDVLEARYPGFTQVKGAPVVDKKPAVPSKEGQTQTAVKPLFQTSKPKDDQVDWSRDPDQHLFISGRFYDKRGVFRTWNPRYK
jgi:hypothetical protein